MSSTSVRDLFLEAANATRSVLAAPEVARGWDGPSALRELSVRGLAGVTEVAIATLLGVGRVRHGDQAVLRALARPERDPVLALRVL